MAPAAASAFACVQLAREHRHGLRVIGTAGTQRGLELVSAEGAHHVLDHSKPDYLAEVMVITEGRGVDLVMEMLANVNLDRDLGMLALSAVASWSSATGAPWRSTRARP